MTDLVHPSDPDTPDTPAACLAVQLANLQAVANVLNLSTDLLNANIKEVEDRINALGLGLTCWITIDKASSIHMGFQRIDKRWGLVVRQGEEVWPITHAPRYLRIKAVSVFPLFLDHLTETAIAAVKRTDSAVETARQFLAGIPPVESGDDQ